jgi:hypothetical protein
MDKVAASIVPSLTAEQQQQYAKRKQDGQCAADKVRCIINYKLAGPMSAAAADTRHGNVCSPATTTSSAAFYTAELQPIAVGNPVQQHLTQHHLQAAAHLPVCVCVRAAPRYPCFLQVNKMFWYLAPTALPSPTGPPALPLQAAANPMASSCMPLSAAATADFAGSGLSQLSLDPKTSNSLQGMTAALHSNQQQQQQFVAPLMQLGCMPGAAAAAAMPPHLQGVAGAAPLLQLAVAAQQMAHAQQMAQMQQLAQVQQQLSAASLNPACRPLQHAGAAAGAGALPGYMGGCGDASAYLGLASQPPLSVPGYQDLQQLSSMIGSMCQV